MTDLARELSRAFPSIRASDDAADRVAYARDLWPRHHLAVRAGRPADHRPGAIVWPTTAEEVASLVRWARKKGVALAPFGAGSGVCAGVLPRSDLVVVDMKRMARIRELDVRGPWVEVEAGHMGVPLERALSKAGLTLGHFPSSILCSTVGGWVASRSAGQCSGRYGKIEDMVVALECVTGDGKIRRLRRRASGPDLVPLVVGSEGTLAIITSATLRLHPSPAARGFGAWSFPTTRSGWDALRGLFQGGLRPAVARLYDPLDAMLARHARPRPSDVDAGEAAPGVGGAAMRALLRRPGLLSELVHSKWVGRAMGGAMLVLVFEDDEVAVRRGIESAGRVATSASGTWIGEGPSRRWFERRYAVSYRQAPLFANGVFVDTMEVAARWSALGGTYDAVRRAVGKSVLVTAHFSHAYPDGCCVYFSFAGSADPRLAATLGWDAACEVTYDRAWRRALDAAIGAGATLGHHHGVGRSKAPRLAAEPGAGVDVVRALMRAFDPGGVLNPGNLVPAIRSETAAAATRRTSPSRPALACEPIVVDRESLLVRIEGSADLADAERQLRALDLTLDVRHAAPVQLGDWLARGAPGARDRWLDPVDQLVAGFEATLADGRTVKVHPAPRRSVGPDLAALFIGAHGRFGRIDRAWLRVHRRGVVRPSVHVFDRERDPPADSGERELLDAIERAL